MIVEAWIDHTFDGHVYQLNGCLTTRISWLDIVTTENILSYQDLILDKLAPLLFLSMPVHDQEMSFV